MERDSRFMKPTLQSQLVIDLMGGARDKGIEDHFILNKAGLGTDVISNLKTRVSLQIYYRILSIVREQLQDEMLGFLKKTVPTRAFPILCDAAVGFTDITGFINFANDFYGLLTDEFEWKLKMNPENTMAVVSVNLKQGANLYKRFIIEFLMVTTYRTLSWLVGEHFFLQSVHFTFSRPEMIKNYRYLLSDRIFFNSKVNEFVFDSGILTRPIIRSRHEVPSFLRSSIDWFLLNPDSCPYTRKIRQLILTKNISEGFPGFEEVSRLLNISHQHLWRKLSIEGTSYQQIKNQIRRDTAIHLLTDTDHTISEIAAYVGYSAERPFYRMFNHWTGMPPGKYRKVFKTDKGKNYYKKKGGQVDS